MKLKVNEIFYSLQGEGSRQGEASIFIRLSDCDLACSYCDTEFVSGKEMSVQDIYDYITGTLYIEAKNYIPIADIKICEWIVWTGGEPALQLTKEIVDWFKEKGFKQQIETNGNNQVPMNLDLITISPKVAEHVLKNNFKRYMYQLDVGRELPEPKRPFLELKYVIGKNKMSVLEPVLNADYYFLSPMFNGNQVDIENVKHCIELCLQNPKWRLSMQIHKLLNIL